MSVEHEESKCSNCGVTGDFCGYHHLSRDKISLCVACAEQDIDVLQITLAGEKTGGIITPSIEEAIETMSAIIREMKDAEVGDGYTVWKRSMRRLLVVTTPEFQGF